MNADTIDAMLAAGVTAEVLAAAWKAQLTAQEEATQSRRARDAERQRRHRESRGVTVTEGASQDKGSLEVSPPAPPLPNPSKSAPLSPPKSGKSFLASDWVPPPVSELPPRARACAEQWTDGSYQTIAEGFALYWRSERKMKPDWRATWANWVLREHSKVMRDQKFGNAPPEIPKYVAPKTPEESLAWWSDQAKFFRRLNREDDAKRCDEHIKALEDANPELAGRVSSLVGRVTREMRVSKARAA